MQNDEIKNNAPADETESGRRPYMDYKPFSGVYGQEGEEPGREQDPYVKNPYAQNAYWKNPYKEEAGSDPGRTGFAIASLVLGILAVCSCCLPVITVPLGILAVVFAVFGMKSLNRGIAVAGFVLGIVSLVLGSMMLIIFLLSTGGNPHYSW